MTIGEIVALASVMVTVGMNVALYIHLSSALGARFDFIERRFELLLGKVIDIDNRLTRVEERMGRRAGSEPVKEWDSGRT